MSNIDRIQKFFDDQSKLMTCKATPAKINSEIGKLRTWLVKHQDEMVPDGSKTKIVSVLEKYNRASDYIAEIRPIVINLFTDYLQLPEGKLVNSKEKTKVLTWLNNMHDCNGTNDSNIETPLVATVSNWCIESCTDAIKTATVYHMDRPDLWKEDLSLGAHFEKARGLLAKGKTVVIDILDGTDTIIKVRADEDEDYNILADDHTRAD